jgi:hypothetical protein
MDLKCLYYFSVVKKCWKFATMALIYTDHENMKMPLFSRRVKGKWQMTCVKLNMQE